MSQSICSIGGCFGTVHGRCLCRKHYARLMRNSSLRPVPRTPRKTVLERFLAKVDQSGGPDACWLWTAGGSNGYGYMSVNWKDVRAHRLSYELLVGPIPGGLELDHLCRNKRCVNPAHLEPVTHHVNVMRGDVGAADAAKTHCLRGHPFDEANTYRPAGPRRRICRKCGRIREAAAAALKNASS